MMHFSKFQICSLVNRPWVQSWGHSWGWSWERILELLSHLNSAKFLYSVSDTWLRFVLARMPCWQHHLQEAWLNDHQLQLYKFPDHSCNDHNSLQHNNHLHPPYQHNHHHHHRIIAVSTSFKKGKETDHSRLGVSTCFGSDLLLVFFSPGTRIMNHDHHH